MIILVGTGHVFDLRAKVEEIIVENKPDIVCVELDEERYKGLLSQEKGIKVRGSESLLYNMLAKFQERVARLYGVNVGNEMLSAIRIAQEKGIPIALIDMNAKNIFEEMWKKMSLKEKFRLLLAAFEGLFVTKSSIEGEIKKLQENYQKLMEEVSKKFPTMKRILIDQRDSFMSRRLLELSNRYNKIVAFVGDGHISGIKKGLGNIEVKVIRLGELVRNGSNTASFSVTYQFDGPVA